MNNMYMALLKLTMLPVESYVAATSGMAERIEVEDMGARKLHRERMQVIMTLRW